MIDSSALSGEGHENVASMIEGKRIVCERAFAASMSYQTAIVVGRGNSQSEINSNLLGRRVGHGSSDDYDKLLKTLSREDLAPKRNLNRNLRPARDDVEWGRMGGVSSGQELAGEAHPLCQAASTYARALRSLCDRMPRRPPPAHINGRECVTL